MKKSGKVLVVAELAREYGFKDVGGMSFYIVPFYIIWADMVSIDSLGAKICKFLTCFDKITSRWRFSFVYLIGDGA